MIPPILACLGHRTGQYTRTRSFCFESRCLPLHASPSLTLNRCRTLYLHWTDRWDAGLLLQVKVFASSNLLTGGVQDQLQPCGDASLATKAIFCCSSVFASRVLWKRASANAPEPQLGGESCMLIGSETAMSRVLLQVWVFASATCISLIGTCPGSICRRGPIRAPL